MKAGLKNKMGKILGYFYVFSLLCIVFSKRERHENMEIGGENKRVCVGWICGFWD